MSWGVGGLKAEMLTRLCSSGTAILGILKPRLLMLTRLRSSGTSNPCFPQTPYALTNVAYSTPYFLQYSLMIDAMSFAVGLVLP